MILVSEEIYCVGTIWEDGTHGEWDILRSCYKTVLSLAVQLGCKSIAFSLMATGAYGYPKAETLDVALQEIGRFRLKTESKNEDMDIYLVVLDDQALELSDKEFGAVEQFIDDSYVSKQRAREYSLTAGLCGDSAVRRSLLQAYIISGRRIFLNPLPNR